ncbi:MAG: aldehyde ferredoxin oxidoreductase family protein [bacterium]
MSYGWWGKILRIDLSEGKIAREEVSERIYEKLIGGAGIGAKIIYEELNQNLGPFSSENKVILATGPWQGTKLPGSAKWSAISKSPLTNTYGESAGAAGFGINLKKAGYDALVIQGKAEKLSYIYINNDKVEVKDAWFLGNKDSLETFQILKRRLNNPKVSIATIGPAGEKLVRFACIVIDEHSFAGRCGIGAVLGSKNIKAIAVYGDKRPSVFSPDKVERLAREQRKKIRNFASENGFTEHGTPGAVFSAAQTANLPVQYWREDSWDKAEKISAPNYTRVLKAKPRACLYCPVACHRQIEIDHPKKYALKGAGPQYESLSFLGSNCLIDDVKAIAKANDICNRLGMDTISAGACVGFAMECLEKRWISKKDSGGLSIRWRRGDDLIQLLEKIGKREDIGDLLAEGTARAAREIGQGAEKIVAQVRGLDVPAWDPRSFFATAINYATGTIGACHERGMCPSLELGLFFPEIGIKEAPKAFDPSGKVDICIKSQNLSALFNSLVICNYMVDGGGMSLTEILECFRAVTGWDWPINKLMEVGERVYNLQRMINIKDTKGKEEDKLPSRFFVPAKTGFRKGMVPPLHEMLKEYYIRRGWDEEGRPTQETLERLGLLY